MSTFSDDIEAYRTRNERALKNLLEAQNKCYVPFKLDPRDMQRLKDLDYAAEHGVDVNAGLEQPIVTKVHPVTGIPFECYRGGKA